MIPSWPPGTQEPFPSLIAGHTSKKKQNPQTHILLLVIYLLTTTTTTLFRLLFRLNSVKIFACVWL